MIVVGPEVVEWVSKRLGGSFANARGVGLSNGQLLAGVVYEDYNGHNVMTHIAAVSNKRWMTRDYLWSIFSYPFDMLQVKRLTACVAEGNTDSRRFVEHLGFTLEARLMEAHTTGDILVYRMFRSECRFLNPERFAKLKERHGERLQPARCA